MKRILLYYFSCAVAAVLSVSASIADAQIIEIPELKGGYPRMVEIGTESEDKKINMEQMEKCLGYVGEDPAWLLSRLQMYWQSHATDIYINGEELDHVEGHAPVPTVRYVANRNGISAFARPPLEEIPPYQDSLGMWMQDRKTGRMMWADPRETGGAAMSINVEILRIARNAAYLYRTGGDRAYAEMAADVFDCFMTGLYYRNVPIDMNHGQQQTLVGLNSFEVIHENTLNPAAECYDLLHDYLVETRPDKISLYEETFKKWAECIIAGGVPHNNWNLIQIQFVLRAALVLNDDDAYADGKGRQHYLNEILNESSIRQWSVAKLIDFGFDKETGLWKECPGYSRMVLGQWDGLAEILEKTLGVDLYAEFPILTKAKQNVGQYLFPNGMSVAWGDGSYAFMPIEGTITPTFHSDEVSYFVARTGMDAQKSLMMSVAGSKGNHMHANGITMELYGKGHVQAPDLGRGRSYTTLDYYEFYSQFPAHNTVCVDGVSSYPEMMSQHGFTLKGCHPAPEKTEGFYEGVYYGDFSFIEPETQSDQRRQLLIINTDPENGYYVDVFRSRRRDGKDKMHDYFYHNVGQDFELDVETAPTEELAFAGGHIYAYSYLWNKHSATTDKDVSGKFTMTFKDGSTTGMNMWMRGEKDRTVFKAYSPRIYSMDGAGLPYDVKTAPTQTYVARQYGEAWTRPFAAVYEPYDNSGSAVASVEWLDCGPDGTVGLQVVRKDGRKDVIMSADAVTAMKCAGVEAVAMLVVASDGQCFMADGTYLETDGIRINTKIPGTVALEKKDGEWYYSSDVPCKVRISGKTYKLESSDFRKMAD